MTTDFALCLPSRPGTLLQVAEALGRAGVNIDGAFGVETAGQGVLHVVVSDAELARRTLLNASVEICAEQTVTVLELENRPGSGAAVLRRVADAGVGVNLLYTTLDGRLVLGSDEPARLRDALANVEGGRDTTPGRT
jgi:hypothetical protein